MKLFAISIIYKSPDRSTTLKAAYNLASFGFFQRGSIQEFMSFTSQIIVERTTVGTRQSIRESEYMCHVYVRNDQLAAVVISDQEYPHRVAHTMIGKLLDDFTNAVPATEWPAGTPVTINFANLEPVLAKYQNPNDADPMSRIQADLDETKIILHNTIGSVLERGEKLDDLIAKSETLSDTSKMFYKTAKKTNACCTWG
jgi:synaptobrevin family protein YKT6